MPSLEGPRLKLARATKHIAELRAAAEGFLAAQPFAIHPVEETNGDLVWKLRMNRSVPVEWSAIVGDAVHNMRSSLDLLAWQLVELGGGQPSRETCFPITASPAANFGATLKRFMSGASPQAMRFVERMRPFAGGNRTLAQLHTLDVIDKHRLVLVVGAANKQLVIKLKMKVPWADKLVEAPPIALNPADRQFPLQDGEEVFRVCKAARGQDPHSEQAVVFELAFGDANEVSGHPLIPTLEAMHAHVTRIVEIAGARLFK
ncbi:MAG: hypothetical protein OEV77_14210 [Nitrospira sp.]|nr:hypothetical protein [Nitrospira sp.]